MRYRSTVVEVSVDCRWGIGRLLTVAAISLSTGDAKEESITYSRVLIERGCSSNCRHFEYICNATCWQALSRKRRDSHEHIPECPIDGKKQSIDRYIYVICRPGRSVLGKTVSEAGGRWPYPKPRAQFFPIRTDLGRQITCLLFSSVEYFVSSFFFWIFTAAIFKPGVRVRLTFRK